MANSLLDFVMSLVRDPDAAARFAADPDQAILDANLTDVTSVDVNNLIPVVSESLCDGGALRGRRRRRRRPWPAMSGQVARQRPRSMRSTTMCRFRRVDDVHYGDRGLCRSAGSGVHSGLDMLDDAGVPDVVGADDRSLQFDGPLIDELPAVDAAGRQRLEPRGHRGSSPRCRLVGIRHLRLFHRQPPRTARPPNGRAVSFVDTV